MKTIDLSKTYTIHVSSLGMNEQDREKLRIELYCFLIGNYYIAEDDEEFLEVQKLNQDFEQQVSEIQKEFFKNWYRTPDDLTIEIS